jgi:putative salt-induced outer membrane protein YdiY
MEEEGLRMYKNWLCTALFVLMCVSQALHADEVVLLNSDRLQGVVLEDNEKQVVIQHSVLGRLTLPRAKVQAVFKEGVKPVPAPEVVQAKPEPKKEIEPLPERKDGPFLTFLADWDSTFEAGASVATGNTEKANIYLRFNTTTKNEKRQWDFDTSYYRDQTDGNVSTNKFTAGLKHEWLFKESPWSIFTQGRFDYDEFQSWDKRVSAAAGAGYLWIDTDDLMVKFKLGAGATKEYGSTDEDVIPELLAGFNLKWNISKNQKFTAGSTIFPDLSEIGEYRIISDAAWVIDLNTVDKVSLKVGIENEYQSQVDAGVKHNDFRLYSAIVFKF